MGTRKYSKKFKGDLLRAFEEYVDNTEIPVIAEFAYKNKIPRSTLYEFKEFEYMRQICIDKKEANLEKLALTKEIDSSMAIFSLKQLGWSDKNQSTITAEVNNPFKDLTLDELRKLASDESD